MSDERVDPNTFIGDVRNHDESSPDYPVEQKVELSPEEVAAALNAMDGGKGYKGYNDWSAGRGKVWCEDYTLDVETARVLIEGKNELAALRFAAQAILDDELSDCRKSLADQLKAALGTLPPSTPYVCSHGYGYGGSIMCVECATAAMTDLQAQVAALTEENARLATLAKVVADYREGCKAGMPINDVWLALDGLRLKAEQAAPDLDAIEARTLYACQSCGTEVGKGEENMYGKCPDCGGPLDPIGECEE